MKKNIISFFIIFFIISIIWGIYNYWNSKNKSAKPSNEIISTIKNVECQCDFFCNEINNQNFQQIFELGINYWNNIGFKTKEDYFKYISYISNSEESEFKKIDRIDYLLRGKCEDNYESRNYIILSVITDNDIKKIEEEVIIDFTNYKYIDYIKNNDYILNMYFKSSLVELYYNHKKWELDKWRNQKSPINVISDKFSSLLKSNYRITDLPDWTLIIKETIDEYLWKLNLSSYSINITQNKDVLNYIAKNSIEDHFFVEKTERQLQIEKLMELTKTLLPNWPHQLENWNYLFWKEYSKSEFREIYHKIIELTVKEM